MGIFYLRCFSITRFCTSDQLIEITAPMTTIFLLIDGSLELENVDFLNWSEREKNIFAWQCFAIEMIFVINVLKCNFSIRI